MSPLDPARLAFGTLTALPVRPPRRVDRPVAGWAMALAPLVGALLGVVVAVVGAVLLALVLDPWLVAVLVIGLLGLCTRLIHWDGLADTADGLGSGRPAGEALEVMRRSDIGPFGVFAVLVVFAVQVAAVASLLGSAGSPLESAGALVAALVLGRCALLVACRTGVPGARSEG
ncbi:MAG: adenosylcobinamide-GDP ribazoletransferase, partial [Actinomycetota bacterium]|nr:adenosylcobinamide-GDP ribazoletransferase [Actinomycetota bacterium]